MSSLQYRRLDTRSYEIRFLKFLEKPDGRTKNLKLQVGYAPISQAPPYSALSYYWGPKTDTELVHVSIDGIRVGIRRNLADALSSCGLGKDSHIWADALCINQKDVDERDHQLGFMGLIYEKAERTVVWLGPAGYYTDIASSYLKTCAEIASGATGNGRVFELSPGTFERYYPNRTYIFQEAMTKVDDVEEARDGLLDMLTRPYWGRIWIIQEITKGKSVTVKCGNRYVDLEMLFLAASTMEEVSIRTKCRLQAIRRFRSQTQGNRERCPLLTALVHTRFSSSSEPRDRIYAILGLTRDGTELVPAASYGEPEEEVFRNLSVRILSSQRRNNALLMARYGQYNTQTSLSRWILRPSTLAKLPPWLTSLSKSNSTSVPWKFDARTSMLYTHATKLATTHVSGYDERRMQSTKEQYVMTPVDRSTLATRFLSRLLRRFSCGTVTRADLVEGDPLTDAFARMIRDANKGFTDYGSQYVFDDCRSTFKEIGQISIQGKNLVDWAFDCISRRHSQGGMPNDIVVRRGDRALDQIKIPDSAFRTIQSTLDDLLCLENHRLKLSVADEAQPVVLSTQSPAWTFDVYQVDQCHLPVLLKRDHDSGHYSILGEACFGKHSDGAWWSAQHTLKEVLRTVQKSELITIRLDPK